jgi:protein involved in polysaccharide export with SLBB domain
MSARFSSWLVLGIAAASMVPLLAAAQDAADLPPLVPHVERDFRLSPGDVIQVRFYYSAELDDTIEIRPDGLISMPFIGETKVEGLTVTELRHQLEELYQPILKQPGITVQVRQFASQKVYVGGEVQRPGVVALKGEMTLLDAVMEAGGSKTTGSTSEVVLIRKSDEGRALRYRLFLKPKNEQQPEAGNVRLQPFDVVLIPETRIARIDRWVDEHIRRMLPVNLTAGFTYLTSSGTILIP